MYYSEGNYTEMGFFFTFHRSGSSFVEFDGLLFLLELSIYLLIIAGIFYGYKFVKNKLGVQDE